METKAPAQAALKDRRLTAWQDNFAKYIYQETGYVPDLQTLKLAMLLQKAYRTSPWNKARLNKADGPDPLPELPYILDEIRAHIPAGRQPDPAASLAAAAADFVSTMAGPAGKPEPVAGLTGAQARFIEHSVADWAKLKREMGPYWEYRVAEPFTTTFVPEPGPDETVIAKMETKIAAATKKAGRRRISKT